MEGMKICPIVHGQDFDELLTNDIIVSFFKELGHTGEIKSITDVVVDQMHQPWRTFATLINRSLSGKTTGLDKLRLSITQIFFGMYYKKNMDYVELPWKDFTYQICNIRDLISAWYRFEVYDHLILNAVVFSDKNEFALHRLPQREGNMNGWLIEDENEPLGYEASDKEVESDLESTASS
ncbi:hypothetical protein Tco_1285493 [Tanacetum coccineum]